MPILLTPITAWVIWWMPAKYYTDLLKTDSTKAEYIEAASNTFKAIGDTSKALQILQKGRRHLPDDKFLLLDEANIYNNREIIMHWSHCCLNYWTKILIMKKLLS